MSASIVLVAFASQSGSTAGIAEVIAAELRARGLEVDCRPASDVDVLTRYDAVVLGSGMFVRSRSSDGGGFLARHADELAARQTWLFCAGPIGHGRTGEPDAHEACAVMDVARATGARGAAAFGTPGLEPSLASFDREPPVDMARVRAWAQEIASAVSGSASRLAAAS